MKILISADMEGISGVVDWMHVSSGNAEYTRFREIMTADVNAAVRGAFAGGADEVLVSDAHGSKTNILIEKLDERAKLNSGATSPYAMMQGYDNGVDAAMFIGYHARSGALGGILAHTVSGRISNVWLNGRVCGEFGNERCFAGFGGCSRDPGFQRSDWLPGGGKMGIRDSESCCENFQRQVRV